MNQPKRTAKQAEEAAAAAYTARSPLRKLMGTAWNVLLVIVFFLIVALIVRAVILNDNPCSDLREPDKSECEASRENDTDNYPR